MNGTDIGAVVDWNSAGAHPSSELSGDGGIEVIECNDTPHIMQNSKWYARILRDFEEITVSRGWPEREQIQLLKGRNEALQWARWDINPMDRF